jgi:hypothetical protein
VNEIHYSFGSCTNSYLVQLLLPRVDWICMLVMIPKCVQWVKKKNPVIGWSQKTSQTLQPSWVTCFYSSKRELIYGFFRLAYLAHTRVGNYPCVYV